MNTTANERQCRPVTASLRVIVNGYAADLEATGTLDELVGLTRKLAALGVEPTNSPLLWQRQQATNGHGGKDREPPICPAHGAPMKPSKYGGFYCTAKLADGSYCKEKVA